MLNVTLKPLNSQLSPAHLRGWVTDPKTGDTLLEFSNNCEVNEAILAFTALMPEIVDFLQLASHEHPMADQLLDRMYQIRSQLESDARQERMVV